MSDWRPSGDWQPSAPLANLRRRAELVTEVRRFFAARGMLEVETPLLGAAAATDLHLASLSTTLAGAPPRTLWLQTSPELHMKRLLAAGSGPIWQLCKAFRDGEAGRRHNPEFTMLEWYRPGWDHHRLMDEVEELLRATLPRLAEAPAAERLTYRDAFRRHAGVDPFTAGAEELRRRAGELGIATGAGSHSGVDASTAHDSWSREDWLHLLFATAVEPRCGWAAPDRAGITFLHDFPASEAALARVRAGDPPVAERFEAFVEGVELANGYHELADPAEQARRFAADVAARRERGLPDVPADARLLAALAHGLPDCAGVALGFDRLAMLALGATSIDEVIAFPIDRA
ncbi:MAG TPA: EF-P lysine aminoacylase EpmA [Thermoanaerobaculia bacterium]|nr:EF-P lysine aminoacylase EpmA [Thermoanaerobaculia bacterium]